LKTSKGLVGLHTQAERNSFSTAQQYISDLQSAASAALKSGKGAVSAAANIADGLPTLSAAAKSNRTLRQEVDLLREALAKLGKEKLINTVVHVTGNGSWAYSQGQGIKVAGNNPRGFATGGLIRQGSGPTADNVLARVSRGELIVPANLVRSGLADNLRGLIPGFKTGGLIPRYTGDVGGMPSWTNNNFAATVNDITSSLASAMARSLKAATASGYPSGSFGSGSAEAIAKRMLGAFGWAANQMGPLISLWDRESGWRWNAKNPTSGAYGIPQALPASKMAAAGADWLTNPTTQIKWGLGYIKTRYGSPSGAWAHEESSGWYDKGGVANGAGFMPKRTLQPERVLSPQQTTAFERLVGALDAKSSGRVSNEPRKMIITGGKIGFDRNGEMYVRNLAIQEARAEIEFASQHTR
jgi:hypothetical protein